MKAVEAKLLAFLKKSPQFVIPIYQRTYSWTEKECLQLWEDILRVGKDDKIAVHFIGSIVYIEEGLSNNTVQSPQLVIDGQQRLTTISLLIAALAKAVGDDEPHEGFSARKLKNYYLVNPEESGERHFKLLLSQTDKTSLTAIVEDREQPEAHSIRVVQNFNLFVDQISSFKGKLETICKGLAKLVVVDIALNRDQDNPQLIFESMNSTGRKLSQADLIRNFILMGLKPSLQTRLYEDYWRRMEVAFGQEGYNTHFDSFMRHYLTVKTGAIPRLDEVYEAFKDHALSIGAAGDGVEPLVMELRDYARYFCAMALGAEADPDLKVALHDLRELKVDVAYPLLLELYVDFKGGVLSKADFLEIIRLVEAYVFRRAVCEIPTNSMNKTFATFSKILKKDRYLESVKAQFLLLPSYRRFPKDDEFERDIQTRDLYNFRSRSYWLRRFENFGRKERVNVDQYTIEHIMPQNKELSATWISSLGPDWKRVHEVWLHTLGNLTLTGYNSEYSDRPFAEKRDMVGGFSQSPLKVNEGLGELNNWDEAAIRRRAADLSKLAPKVWSSPKLAHDIVESYRIKSIEKATYSLSDHHHLISSPTKELYEAFRTEILALDPCVTEEFLKRYVAFKAETNFVDVVPQAKQLRVMLNMRFADVSDPKGICRDVTGLGRWGNGDVEVKLEKVDEVGYVVGLARQSLDRQLGNDDPF